MVTNLDILRRICEPVWEEIKESNPNMSELNLNRLLDEKIPSGFREDKKTRLSSVSDRNYAFLIKRYDLPKLVGRLKEKGYNFEVRKEEALGVGDFIYARKENREYILACGPLGYVHFLVPRDMDEDTAVKFVEDLFS